MNRKVVTLRKNIYIRWIYGKKRIGSGNLLEINYVSKFKLWQSNKLTEWQTTLNAFSNLFAYSLVASFVVVATFFLLSLLPSLFITSYLIFPSNHIFHSVSLSLSIYEPNPWKWIFWTWISQYVLFLSYVFELLWMGVMIIFWRCHFLGLCLMGL